MVVGYGIARILVLGAVFSILSACSLNNIEDWPDDLPSVDHFVAAYEADPVNQQYRPQCLFVLGGGILSRQYSVSDRLARY